MTQVTVQREPDQKSSEKAPPKAETISPHAEPTRHWIHPVRAMRMWLNAAPVTWLLPLHPFRWRGALYVPDFDVKETPDSFVLKADVPGIKASELDVKITRDRLTVSGHREEEKSKKGDTYYAYERSYGSFSRSFALPEGADPNRIEASLTDGVLTLTVAKRPVAREKQVPVRESH